MSFVQLGRAADFLEAHVPSASSKSLATDTALDITSITLTEGDWDVWGQVAFGPASSTSVSRLQAAVSTASAQIPAPSAIDGSRFSKVHAAEVPGPNSQVYAVAPARIVVAAGQTQTVYLVGYGVFTVSTLVCYGKICARRRPI